MVIGVNYIEKISLMGYMIILSVAKKCLYDSEVTVKTMFSCDRFGIQVIIASTIEFTNHCESLHDRWSFLSWKTESEFETYILSILITIEHALIT